MSRIDIEGVSKRYGGFTALDRVDLVVEEGEFLTLLGPSGCGKTTTLRLVAGFIEPTSGRILFDGEEVTDWPPQKRVIGMVFQSYALFPHLTVTENVAFALRERGHQRSDIQTRVKELLDLVQLPGLEGRYPAELSGGQQQRVALARAVAHTPRVLLMDEPLGALDLKLREAMQFELRRIQKELRITTIYVTHDQIEAMSMSDRIAIVNQGKIAQLGPPEELYNRPRTRFVADFVGKINLLAADVREATGAEIVAEAAGRVLRAAQSSRSTPVRTGSITLGVRPEHIALSLGSCTSSEYNSVPGHVERTVFVGNILNVTVDLGRGVYLNVETRPGDPLAIPGKRVCANWMYQHTIVLDGD